MSKRIGMTNAQKVEHYPVVARQLNITDCMLSDVVNGLVTYGAWVKDSDGGKIRVGISRAETFPIAMVTFRYGKQRDSVCVYSLDEYEARMRDLRTRCESYESTIQAINSAKDALRAVTLSEVA